ncbi:MAG: hypothetical protein ACO3DQ_10110 [Cephaloticoccus sp.]
MTPDDLTVDYYVDCHGHDCYRICHPESGLCSTVSSAHLIEERKAQLLRRFTPTPTPRP